MSVSMAASAQPDMSNLTCRQQHCELPAHLPLLIMHDTMMHALSKMVVEKSNPLQVTTP
jgi:hypothetical protein